MEFDPVCLKKLFPCFLGGNFILGEKKLSWTAESFIIYHTHIAESSSSSFYFSSVTHAPAKVRIISNMENETKSDLL